MNTKISKRIYYLDWLRVIGILTVFLFHSTRFFDPSDWHVKNHATYAAVDVLQNFLESWMMPLMFLISGASLYYTMRKGGASWFFKDKFMRLGVPLLVGVFTHASLQVYLERLTHGQFRGSYFEFLPHYFDGIYIDTGVGGNFAFAGMHLWYLLVLFAFIVLCYPVLRWLVGSGRRVLDGLGGFLALPGVVYLLILPIFLFFDAVEDVLGPGGWPLPVYICFFLVGFVIFSHEHLQKRIWQMRWISLVFGAAVIAVYGFLMLRSRYASLFGDLNGLLYCAISWFLLMAILGFSMQHLDFSTPFVKYANEAVLPFYILHQTVLLCVGYFVVEWAIPDVQRWAAILTISFATIMLLYEFLVRRVALLRFLFGMKIPQKRQVEPAVQIQEAAS